MTTQRLEAPVVEDDTATSQLGIAFVSLCGLLGTVMTAKTPTSISWLKFDDVFSMLAVGGAFAVGIGSYALAVARRLVSAFGPFLATFCFAGLATVTADSFSDIDIYFAVLRIAAYFSGAAFSAAALMLLSRENLRRLIVSTLAFLLFISIVQQVLYRVGIDIRVLRVYGFEYLRWDKAPLPRSPSLAREPAYLGIAVISMALLLARSGQLTRRAMLIVASILTLAAALSSIAIAAVAYFAHQRRVTTGTLMGVLIMLFVGITSYMGSPGIRTNIDGRVVERVMGIFDGSDPAAAGRTLTSWTAATQVLENSVLLGVGPGQLGPVFQRGLDSGMFELTWATAFLESGGTWNTFANVLAEFGVLGLAAFLFGVSKLKMPWAPLVLVVGFAVGGPYQFNFWFVVALGIAALRFDDETKSAALRTPIHA